MSARDLTADRRRAGLALAIDAATTEVVRAFAGARIRAILIKGPAIAARLYDDPAERPYGDIDLLVAPASRADAGRTLHALGFRDRLPSRRANEVMAHADTWVRAHPRAATVDLHTGLYWCAGDPDVLWVDFSRGTRWITLGATRVEVLGDPAQALVIATHAAQHPAHPKTLEDLRRALARIDREALGEAATMATRLGAAPAFAAGLRRLPEGARLVDEFGLHDEESATVRLRIAGDPPTARVFLLLAKPGSARARLKLLASELLPSPEFMRLARPLARRGPIGLAAAYIERLLWLAAQAPAGLRAARAASAPQRPTGRNRQVRLRALAPANVLAAAWAWRTSTCARRQLAQGGLEALSLPEPPARALRGHRGVAAVLARRRLSCLERSAVRQRWHLAHGTARDLIIGVTGSGPFGAHAWLDGDTEQADGDHVRLMRWPAGHQETGRARSGRVR
jgi:hypothetical protein